MFSSSSDSDSEDFNFARERRYSKRRCIDFEYPEDERQRFRLTNKQLEELEKRLENTIDSPTARSHSLSVKEKVRISCRLLASGADQKIVGDAHGVHKSTVSRVLHEFVDAVNAVILPTVVDWPRDEEDLRKIVTQFRDLSGVPSVFGCVDGTHVRIKKPVENESQFVNRHGNHSLNVMLVCGPNLQFYFASVKWPGSVSDARVFRNSFLAERLQNGWRPVRNGILLGDSGYPNLDYLITPILLPQSDNEKRFNIAHCKTRRIIECAIGVLKQRFRILMQTMPYEPVRAANIIRCCVALHNLMVKPSDIPEESGEDESNEVNDEATNSVRRAQLVQLFDE